MTAETMPACAPLPVSATRHHAALTVRHGRVYYAVRSAARVLTFAALGGSLAVAMWVAAMLASVLTP